MSTNTPTPHTDALLAQFHTEFPRPMGEPVDRYLAMISDMSFLVGVQLVLLKLNEERQNHGEQGAMQADALLRSEAVAALNNAKCEAAALLAVFNAMTRKP